MQSVVETIIEASEKIQTQEATISNLNTQIATDDSNFDDIYDAIVDKGQQPTKADRTTYAPAIEAIVTGGTYQTKSVTPTTSAQVVTPDQGYDALDEVDVAAVTSSIDSNIQAGNIKNGVTILGVQGTYTGGVSPVLDTLNVTPTTSYQHITPPSGTDGFDEVNVDAVDASIDANIVAGNIKNGITILGVQGTYSGGEQPTLQNKTVSPDFSSGDVSVQADSGYDGLGTVTIEKDNDLIASNIKKNVNLFGVIGSYEASGIVLNQHPTNLQYACTDGQSYANVLPADGSWTTEVDLSAITNANAMRYMFQNNTEVEDLDLTGWTIPDLAMNCTAVFQGCSALKYVRGSLAFSKSTNFNNMFSGCTSLITVGIVDFGFSATTSSLTLDLSASAVLDIDTLITNMNTNNSGKTRIIKLEATVLAGVSSATAALAASKNITLQ